MDQTTDRGTVRIIAAGLITIALAVAAGLLAIVAYGDLDAETRRYALTTAGTMGTTALGAGAALLASTRNAGPPVTARPRPVVDTTETGDILPPG